MAGLASQHRKTGLIFSSVIGVIHTQIVSLGMLWCKVDIFATQKPSVVSNPRWVLLRAGGPVARRRSFLFDKQGEHTKQASRETRCRAAVKPRPSSMSVEHPPRPMGAGGVKGHCPLCEPRGPLPSGGNSAAKSHVLRVLPRPMGAEWGAGGHPLRAVRKGAQPPWMSTGRSVSWKGSVSPLRS